MVTAFVMIRVEASHLSSVAGAIANIEHVAEVYSVTGEYDIIAILRLPEYDLLAQTVPDKLAQLAGVLETRTVLAFRSFSREDMQAAWDIGLS